jgi:hypothetical protein
MSRMQRHERQSNSCKQIPSYDDVTKDSHDPIFLLIWNLGGCPLTPQMKRLSPVPGAESHGRAIPNDAHNVKLPFHFILCIVKRNVKSAFHLDDLSILIRFRAIGRISSESSCEIDARIQAPISLGFRAGLAGYAALLKSSLKIKDS